MKNKLGNVLLMGRKGCPYSKKLQKLLKKKSKKLYYFESKKIGEKIDHKYIKLNYNYIFCFRSFYILRKNILKKVKKSAINFHPGPPEYRGTGCVNYAVYGNSKYYGCTAHLIDKKIDNGKILDVKKFSIKKSDDISKILDKTYRTMLKQSVFIINQIQVDSNFIDKQIKKNNKMKWSKKTKSLKDLNDFYIIDKNIKKRDFLKKIRATNTPNFKPYIKLHGKKFILE